MSKLFPGLAWGILVALLSSAACTITPGACGGSYPDACNGYCTNFADDPSNCGGCGYVCGGNAACRNGQCVPQAQAQCTPDGYGCAANVDCCSGVCDATNTCVSPVSGCLPDNAACGTSADCCSGLCAADGYCGVPSCGVQGDACATDNDCCSPLFCDNGGCSTCVSSGNPCNVDADCCSGSCAGGACY